MAGSSEKGAYYVFEMAKKDRRQPLRQVNKEPLTLDRAKKLARIGAQKGTHDRAVTTSPTSRAFKIVMQYAAGSGKDVAIMYRRGSGGGAKRKSVSRKKNGAASEPAAEQVDQEEWEQPAPEPELHPHVSADEV